MQSKRRFTAREETIYRDLRNIVVQMGATSLRVSSGLISEDGQGAVEVVFDRAGKRYVFRCSKYESPLDNLRATQLAITYLWRALEQYGVEGSESDVLFETFFLGFTPPPGDAVLMLPGGTEAWWDVLGVQQDAGEVEIRNAFRALARVHHPDAGGDAVAFQRLRMAYDQAMGR